MERSDFNNILRDFSESRSALKAAIVAFAFNSETTLTHKRQVVPLEHYDFLLQAESEREVYQILKGDPDLQGRPAPNPLEIELLALSNGKDILLHEPLAKYAAGENDYVAILFAQFTQTEQAIAQANPEFYELVKKTDLRL